MKILAAEKAVVVNGSVKFGSAILPISSVALKVAHYKRFSFLTVTKKLMVSNTGQAKSHFAGCDAPH